MDTKVVLDLLTKIQPGMHETMYPQQSEQVILNQGHSLDIINQNFKSGIRAGRTTYADTLICQDLCFIVAQSQMLAHASGDRSGNQKQAILELIANYEDDWCGNDWPKKFPPRPKELELTEYSLDDKVDAAVRFYQASFVVKDHQIESALIEAAVRILEIAMSSKEMKEPSRNYRERSGANMMR